MTKQKFKNGRKNQAGVQCRRKYNPLKNGSAVGNSIGKPIGIEHAEWDFAPYIDVLPVVSSHRK